MIETSELKECRFLEDFTESELAALASIGTPTHWKEGETIFQARSPATHLYILKTGSVLLCFPNGRSYAVRHSGWAIGWSSLVSPFHYTASALCLTDTTLYQFPSVELYNLLRMDSNLGYRLMNKITQIMEQRKPYFRAARKKP